MSGITSSTHSTQTTTTTTTSGQTETKTSSSQEPKGLWYSEGTHKYYKTKADLTAAETLYRQDRLERQYATRRYTYMDHEKTHGIYSTPPGY